MANAGNTTSVLAPRVIIPTPPKWQTPIRPFVLGRYGILNPKALAGSLPITMQQAAFPVPPQSALPPADSVVIVSGAPNPAAKGLLAAVSGLGRFVRPALGAIMRGVRGFGRGMVAVASAMDTLDQELNPREDSVPDRFYVRDRGLARSSTFARRVLGQTIDAWVICSLLDAMEAGQKEFHILILGPGWGNTEKELVERLAPTVQSLGMRLNITMFHKPEHPLAAGNLAFMREHEKSGVRISPEPKNFDRDEFPRNLDMVIGVMSTIYSENQDRLTARIHNALRPPSENRPGGQAFFMYQVWHEEPAAGLRRRHFEMQRRGLDITVIAPPGEITALAHMVRISREEIEGVQSELEAVSHEKTFIGFRATRWADPVDAEKTGLEDAFGIFMTGAHDLFRHHGINPDSLSRNGHRFAFERVQPGILAGQPVLPDAISTAYDDPAIISAIGQYGDGYIGHLPPSGRGMTLMQALSAAYGKRNGQFTTHGGMY